jgi:hypothetical protein
MGQYNSKYELQDFQTNQNQSEEYNLYEWQHTKPKNVQYYTGERFFKIPRHFYPDQFQRGLIYGYTYIPQYHYTNYIDEED